MGLENVTKTNALKAWRKGQKNILRRFDFMVQFHVGGTHETTLQQEIGPMPKIEPWHVINVSIPDYSFKKEALSYGGSIQRPFPVLDTTGFDLRIEMVEDGNGTVRQFIEWLKRRVMTQDGIYRGADIPKLSPGLLVESFDMQGIPIVRYIFSDLFFLKADPISFDYNEGSKIQYLLNFACSGHIIDFPQSKDDK